MSQNILMNAITIGIIAIAGAGYLSYKDKQGLGVDAEQAKPAKVSATLVRAEQVPKRRTSASTVTLQKDQRNGHFWTQAKVNTGSVRFLVDTGASTVALTLNDAKKSGIKIRDLKFNVPVSTAGGTNYGAYVKLERLSVGAITLRDIDALVIKEGLSTSLLGMSFLGELQKVEVTPKTLFLRL